MGGRVGHIPATRRPVEDGDRARVPAVTLLAEIRAAAPGPGRPLPHPVRARLQAGFGTDVGDVRLQDDPAAQAVAGDFDALAVTAGERIYLGRAAPRPSSAAGLRLIAHEVAHVLQQRAASAPARRAVSEPGGREESAADAGAAAVVAGRPAAAPVPAAAAVQPTRTDGSQQDEEQEKKEEEEGESVRPADIADIAEMAELRPENEVRPEKASEEKAEEEVRGQATVASDAPARAQAEPTGPATVNPLEVDLALEGKLGERNFYISPVAQRSAEYTDMFVDELRKRYPDKQVPKGLVNAAVVAVNTHVAAGGRLTPPLIQQEITRQEATLALAATVLAAPPASLALDRFVTELEARRGAYTWSPGTSDAFTAWLTGTAQSLDVEARINCWEAVLAAAGTAGLLTKPQLHEAYKNTNRQHGVEQLLAGSGVEHTIKHTATTPGPNRVQRGEIITIPGPDGPLQHVVAVVEANQQDYAAIKVMSLWGETQKGGGAFSRVPLGTLLPPVATLRHVLLRPPNPPRQSQAGTTRLLSFFLQNQGGIK